MDEYEKKLKELRTYVPFLTKMIDKLEKAGDKSKEAQLAKMKSLKVILTASNKKLQLETLEKCEGVLHKLYEQVEGPVDTKSSSKNQNVSANSCKDDAKKKLNPNFKRTLPISRVYSRIIACSS